MQPPPYSRAFSFTDNETDDPTGHVPGVNVDGELDGIATTLKVVLANLVKLQRDDGALVNGLVTMDALSPAIIAMFAAASSWNVRGVWVTGTAYARSDIITQATATYVAAVDHVSAALLATDIAAGRWVLLFDSAGTIPADGSVTSPKIANGAVLADHVGFTGLDLTGSSRFGAGVAAGTAPLGSLLHAKLAAGDVIGKVERTTSAQGVVGFEIIDPAVTWTVQMAPGSTELDIVHDGTVVARFHSDASLMDVPGSIRAASTAAGANAGTTLTFTANVGYVQAFDITANLWRDLKLQGAGVFLTAGGVDVLHATSTGVDFPLGLTNQGIAVGFLGIPQNEQSGPYTILASDIGKDVYSENTVAQTITVPVLPAGSSLTVTNDGISPITLHGDGTTLKLSGTATTGDRTIGANGQAFMKWVKDGTHVRVGGPGTS